MATPYFRYCTRNRFCISENDISLELFLRSTLDLIVGILCTSVDNKIIHEICYIFNEALCSKKIVSIGDRENWFFICK